MYVLHHADRPSLYSGLPDEPRISPVVQVWKGILKPLAVLGIAAAVIGSFFHWVTVGPNEVQDEDEAEADRAMREIEEEEKSP